jgi:hypothetical protein
MGRMLPREPLEVADTTTELDVTPSLVELNQAVESAAALFARRVRLLTRPLPLWTGLYPHGARLPFGCQRRWLLSAGMYVLTDNSSGPSRQEAHLRVLHGYEAGIRGRLLPNLVDAPSLSLQVPWLARAKRSSRCTEQLLPISAAQWNASRPDLSRQRSGPVPQTGGARHCLYGLSGSASDIAPGGVPLAPACDLVVNWMKAWQGPVLAPSGTGNALQCRQCRFRTGFSALCYRNKNSGLYAL